MVFTGAYLEIVEAFQEVSGAFKEGWVSEGYQKLSGSFQGVLGRCKGYHVVLEGLHRVSGAFK